MLCVAHAVASEAEAEGNRRPKHIQLSQTHRPKGSKQSLAAGGADGGPKQFYYPIGGGYVPDMFSETSSGSTMRVERGEESKKQRIELKKNLEK